MKWCICNKLSINIDKTKSMIVHGRSIDVNQESLLKIGGKSLQNVSRYEYLGVVMDDKLNMNGHIEHITKKVQGKLCVLRKIRRHITEASALLIFKTLIMCHFDYGDFTVDSGTKVIVDRLDRLHTRALRCIEYRHEVDNGMNITELYHRYNLESLETRRKRHLLKIMFIESKSETNIDVYHPQMVLRSTLNVKMKHKFTRLTKVLRSPHYRGLELWDQLPAEIQNIDNRMTFKERIKLYKL